MEKQCENCRFMRRAEGKQKGMYQCHLHPPVLLASGSSHVTRWPEVDKNAWCGDYKQNPDEDEASVQHF